jgi:actin-related protein 10
MSILENLIDKPAVVLDVGLAYTKCGFAGEYAPHSIIFTPIDNQLSKTYDEILLRETLVEFIYRIYYKHLNANSRERKVVVVESVLTPNKFRQTLAEVLFKDFHVLSVSFLSSHVASLYTLGINTALIIDCGYSDCQVLPIAEGMQMTGLCDFLNLGAQRLHQHIEKLIREHAQIKVGTKVLPFKDVQPEPELNEEILEDIKIRCCFVTSFQRGRQYEQELSSKLASNQSIENLEFKFISSCEYNLKNNLILIIQAWFARQLWKYCSKILSIPNKLFKTLFWTQSLNAQSILKRRLFRTSF